MLNFYFIANYFCCYCKSTIILQETNIKSANFIKVTPYQHPRCGQILVMKGWWISLLALYKGTAFVTYLLFSLFLHFKEAPKYWYYSEASSNNQTINHGFLLPSEQKMQSTTTPKTKLIMANMISPIRQSWEFPTIMNI